MTTKRILYQRPDGGISIRVAVEPPLPGESEAMYLDRIAIQAPPAGATRLPDVEAAAMPTSRRLRNCWRYSSGVVSVHLPSARQQRLGEIRAERNARLLESDAEKARLDEIGTPQQRATLTAYRQQLRDLPAAAAADLAGLTSAAELEAYQPTWPTPPQG